jgi:hypothetical protein
MAVQRTASTPHPASLGRLSGHARSTHAPDAASNPHSRRRRPRPARRSRGFLPRGLSDACPLNGALRSRPRPTCGGRRRITLNGPGLPPPPAAARRRPPPPAARRRPPPRIRRVIDEIADLSDRRPTPTRPTMAAVTRRSLAWTATAVRSTSTSFLVGFLPGGDAGVDRRCRSPGPGQGAVAGGTPAVGCRRVRRRAGRWESPAHWRHSRHNKSQHSATRRPRRRQTKARRLSSTDRRTAGDPAAGRVYPLSTWGQKRQRPAGRPF